MATALQSPPPSHLVLRLRLASRSGMPGPIDGAWRPRSYDLLAELPQLLAGLPRAWRHITSVTVNGATWSAVPGRIFVLNQVVRLHRTVAASASHTIVLLAPGRGAGICWSCLRIRPKRLRNRSWRPRQVATTDPAHDGLPGESSGHRRPGAATTTVTSHYQPGGPAGRGLARRGSFAGLFRRHEGGRGGPRRRIRGVGRVREPNVCEVAGDGGRALKAFFDQPLASGVREFGRSALGRQDILPSQRGSPTETPDQVHDHPGREASEPTACAAAAKAACPQGST
ncbi:hypothetical protein MBT84_38910 [Streptomyces sp. MBT84]|nr:hypothetical protein [Streptomyces sp. MBT84]